MVQRRMRLKRGKEGDTGVALVAPPAVAASQTAPLPDRPVRAAAVLHHVDVEISGAEFREMTNIDGTIHMVCTRGARALITVHGIGDPRALLREAASRIYEDGTTFRVRNPNDL